MSLTSDDLAFIRDLMSCVDSDLVIDSFVVLPNFTRTVNCTLTDGYQVQIVVTVTPPQG